VVNPALNNWLENGSGSGMEFLQVILSDPQAQALVAAVVLPQLAQTVTAGWKALPTKEQLRKIVDESAALETVRNTLTLEQRRHVADAICEAIERMRNRWKLAVDGRGALEAFRLSLLNNAASVRDSLMCSEWTRHRRSLSIPARARFSSQDAGERLRESAVVKGTFLHFGTQEKPKTRSASLPRSSRMTRPFRLTQRPQVVVRNTFLTVGEPARQNNRALSTPPNLRMARSDQILQCQQSDEDVSTAASTCSFLPDQATPDSVPSIAPPVVVEEGFSPELSELLRRPDAGQTTVVVRNVPVTCTQQFLLDAWTQLGFAESIDLLYLPMDVRTRMNLRYCFVNFVSEEAAQTFCSKFEGSSVLTTSLARIQGFASNFLNIRHSTKMSRNIAAEFLPLIFNPATGDQVEFPRPIGGSRRSKKSSDFSALQRRLAARIGTVLDDQTAKLVLEGTIKAYHARERRSDLEALVRSVEQDDNKLNEVVRFACNQLALAGYSM